MIVNCRAFDTDLIWLLLKLNMGVAVVFSVTRF